MGSRYPAALCEIEVEDERNNAVSGKVPRNDQELRDMFSKRDVRLVQLNKDGLGASSSVGSTSPCAPPVQQLPPPPPVHTTGAKRFAASPPPGFAGIGQPQQKRYLMEGGAHCIPGPSRQPSVNTSQLKPTTAAAKNKATIPCAVCGVWCMTALHFRQHEQGRKHRNKVAYLAGELDVWCQVCNVHISGALNVEQHYAGKQHLRMLQTDGI